MPQQVEITIVSAASSLSRATLVIGVPPRHRRQARKRTRRANSYAIRLGATKSLIDRPPALLKSTTRATTKIVADRVNAKRAKRAMRSWRSSVASALLAGARLIEEVVCKSEDYHGGHAATSVGCPMNMTCGIVHCRLRNVSLHCFCLRDRYDRDGHLRRAYAPSTAEG